MKSFLTNLPELTQRLITGIIGAFLLITGLVYSEWAYFAIFFFICMSCMLEFYKLLGIYGNQPLRTYGTINGLYIYTISFFVTSGHLEPKYLLTVFLGFSAVYLIKLYIKKDKHPFMNIGFTFLGIIYVGIPFSLLHSAVYFDGQYNFEVIVGSLLILWANDTGAYFAGKKFGHKKLFERVSPKKTWEGSIGGGLLAISMALFLAYLFGEVDYWKWVFFAILIAVAGTYGDLVESLFKRSMLIKDSGNSIPGHGGFLDRFDGLLITAPFIAAFMNLI